MSDCDDLAKDCGLTVKCNKINCEQNCQIYDRCKKYSICKEMLVEYMNKVHKWKIK